MTKPLAVTLGDPCGIGPELILKLASGRLDTPIVVYGARAVLDWTAEQIGGLRRFTGPVVDVQAFAGPPFDFDFGRPSAQSASLQHRALCKAVEDTLSGQTAGVVTCPWSKHTLPLCGLPATGHTEVLAKLTGTPQPTMALCGDELRVALATTHLPLSAVSLALDAEMISQHLRTIDRDLRRRFGLQQPRIAVCGLNPHAGEAGIMGLEDDAVIRPAVERAQADGLAVEGPFAADSLFPKVVRQQSHDIVLAMYHDQGLIPLKLWHVGAAANVTLGLPIVRTSVDHGTAYDIAGQGRADPGSLAYAIRLATRLSATSPAA